MKIKTTTIEKFCELCYTSIYNVRREFKIHHDPNYHNISQFSLSGGRVDHSIVFTALACRFRCIDTFLEIGTCVGSTLSFCYKLFDADNFITIDIKAWPKVEEKLGKLDVCRIVAPSSSLRETDLKPDITFVDGCHFLPTVKEDIEWALNNTKKVIVFDDVAQMEGVTDVVSAIESLLPDYPQLEDVMYIRSTQGAGSWIGVLFC